MTVTACIVSCASPEARRCRDESLDPAVRVAACAAAFAEGDVQAGAPAAELELELGNHEAVIGWLEHLQGTPGQDRAALAAASSHWREGDRDAAENLYHRVLDRGVSGNAVDDRAEVSARAHYGLFYMAWERSDLGTALEHARASADFAARAGDPALSSRAAQAEAMLSYDLGDLDGVGRAVDAAEVLLTDAQASDRARLLNFRALVHLDRGRPRLARITLRQALEATTGEEEARLFRSIHINLARAALDLGELETAADHLRDAEAHLDSDGEPTTALRVYRARLAWARQDFAPVRSATEAALDAGAPDDWAWELEMLRGRAAEAAGDPAAALDAFTAAAALVEGLRQGLGAEELQAWTLARKRRPFEAMFRLHIAAGELGKAVDAAERARARRFLDAWIEATAQASTASDGARAADRWRAFGELSPVFGSADGTALHDGLDAPAVLSYFEAERELWLIRLGTDREPIARRLQDPPNGSLAELRDRWLADPSDPALAATLSDYLLPADLAPPPNTPILLVPDDRWGLLPFAALRRGGRYWIENHHITLVPSLRRRPAAADAAAPIDPPRVLGDPLGDLPAARREASRVASTLAVEPHIGSGADRAALLATERPRVLHLATHTGVGPSGPWLQLADGRVTLDALLATSWRPRLLVLATCAGADRRDLGPWGSLAGGLLAGGVDQVLAALWSLDDAAAERTMRAFYTHLDGDAAEALAQAQRQAIAEGRSVEEWASFVLLTHPDTVRGQRSTISGP